MDRDLFDAMTRAFAARPSRRSALAALCGALFLGTVEAAASKRKGRGKGHHASGAGKQNRKRSGSGGSGRKRKPKCTRKGEVWRPGRPCCKKLRKSRDGICGGLDPAPKSCAATCTGCCDGKNCVTDLTAARCGVAGASCAPCADCQRCDVMAGCVPDATRNECCGAGGTRHCANGTCVSCPAGQTCLSGECQGELECSPECPPGKYCENGECKDDVAQCPSPCDEHQSCVAGECMCDPSKCASNCCSGTECETAEFACAAAGRTCGTIHDSCDHQIDCGSCDPGSCCGGDCCTGVCCDDECFVGGVCCEVAKCEPAGNACADHNCLCGTVAACPAAQPTCCDPLVANTCADLFTDKNNCGACDNRCGPDEECCDGECVNILSSTDHCGSCSNRCVEGEQCIDGKCLCNTEVGQETTCAGNEQCVSKICVTCGITAICGGSCQECPPPPGIGHPLPNDAFCCEDATHSYCSCGRACCGEQGLCFLRGTPSNPIGEFCCTGEEGHVCGADTDSPVCCAKGVSCDSCMHTSGGRVGSYRRPR